MVHVRDATRDDAAQAAALLHLAQGKASTPVHGLGDPDWARSYYQWMFCQSGTFWTYDMTAVAVDGDEIIGLVACYPNDNERAYRTSRNNAAIAQFYRARHAEALTEYSRRYSLYSDGTPPVSVRGIYVMNLAVAPAERRRGIASALLNAVDGIRVAHSYECCCLHVEIGNQDAINVFQRDGYSVIARGSGVGCQSLCGFDGYLYMVKPPC